MVQGSLPSAAPFQGSKAWITSKHCRWSWFILVWLQRSWCSKSIDFVRLSAGEHYLKTLRIMKGCKRIPCREAPAHYLCLVHSWQVPACLKWFCICMHPVLCSYHHIISHISVSICATYIYLYPCVGSDRSTGRTPRTQQYATALKIISKVQTPNLYPENQGFGWFLS